MIGIIVSFIISLDISIFDGSCIVHSCIIRISMIIDADGCIVRFGCYRCFFTVRTR